VAFPRLIAHVEAEREGDVMLCDLQREEESAAEVRHVADLDDVAAAGGEEHVARNALIVRLRDQAVRSRRVDDFPRLAAERSTRPCDLDRRAGIVGDGDVAVGEAAEEERFPDVRVADEDEGLRKLRHSLNKYGASANAGT